MLTVTVTDGIFSGVFTDAVPDGESSQASVGVLAFDEVRWACSTPHGGLMRPEFGSISFAPSVFAAVDSSWWPPPRVLKQISISWSDEGGSFSVPVTFAGYLDELTDETVTYTLHALSEPTATTRDVRYRGTLASVFQTIAAELGLIASITNAREPSPTIDWFVSGENLLIDNLDKMAAFFTHVIYFSDTTAYLIDIYGTAPSTITLTPGDIIDAGIVPVGPYSRITAPWSPPYQTRLRLTIRDRDDGGTTGVAISEVDIARQVGGTLVAPDYGIGVSTTGATDTTSMVDGNAATYWTSGGLTNGAEVSLLVTVGIIAEYALMARPSGAPYMPITWDLAGWNPYTSDYEHITYVTTTAPWSAAEQRRFPVPEDITWTVTYDMAYQAADGPIVLGDEYRLPYSCATRHTNIYGALANISTIIGSGATGRSRTRLTLPIRSIFPGWRVMVTGMELGGPAPAKYWCLAHALTYDFIGGTVTVEGPGGIYL